MPQRLIKREKKKKSEKYLHLAVQLCSTGTRRSSLVSHSLLGVQDKQHSSWPGRTLTCISSYPGRWAVVKDSRECLVQFSLREDAAPIGKTEIFITKRSQSSKKSLLLKLWDKTKIRLVSHLLIITSFLCKDFWLVILNELLKDSHILTSHRRGDKNDSNIQAAQF